MTSSDKIATSYFQAVASGDRAALAELFAEDIVYRFPGRSSFAANYEGRDAVLAYLDRLREMTGSSLGVEILDVMTSEKRAVGFVRATATRHGSEFSWQLLAVIVPRNDKIEEISLFYDDQYGVDEFLHIEAK